MRNVFAGGDQPIVHACFAIAGRRQVDVVDVGLAAFQMVSQSLQRLPRPVVAHHISIKDQIHRPVVQGDVVQVVGNVVLVAVLPVPDAGQGDGARAARDQGVSLLLPVGEKQGDGRIRQLRSAERRAICLHRLALWNLILDGVL